ncbi:sigma 54-interacting transcriptional regulator [Myxococcota bacterium]
MVHDSPAGATCPAEPTRSPSTTRPDWVIWWVFPTSTGLLGLLSPPRAILGRGHGCDPQLDGQEVSRQHAEVRHAGHTILLRDLGSTNGVFLNGKRLSAEAALSEGDVVRLGEWVGVVGLLDNGARAHTGWFAEVGLGILTGPVTRPIFEQVHRVASSDLPVVVEGETGSGKECVAQALHAWSERRSNPFHSVNCAAWPEPLAEAELFGYRAGAFAGAEQSKPGQFQAARGGTLLLDEITDLPLGTQARLLGVLERREVVPLGERNSITVDVRIVAASQEPLLSALRAGRLRSDLYAHLAGITIQLPPLRHRVAEIPPLFGRLLSRHAAGSPPPVDARLVERLCLYDWPFNVRELELLVRRLVALRGRGFVLQREHLPKRCLEPNADCVPPSGAPEDADERAERELAALAASLRAHGGNVARAAQKLGISRQRAYRLMATTDTIDWKALRQVGDGRSGPSGQRPAHELP